MKDEENSALIWLSSSYFCQNDILISIGSIYNNAVTIFLQFFNLTSTTNLKIKGMVNTRFKSCFLFAGDKVIGSRRDRQITSIVRNWVVC